MCVQHSRDNSNCSEKKIGFGTSHCMKAQIEREIVPPNMRRCTGKLKESPLNK